MKVHTRGCLEVLGYQVSHMETLWMTPGYYVLRHLDVGELLGYCLDTIWSVTRVESINPQIQIDCKNIAVV